MRRGGIEMKRFLAVLGAACLGAIMSSCGVDKPFLPEGHNTLVLVALDTSGVFGMGRREVSGAKVEISSPTFVYRKEAVTDAEGRLVLENLPSGDYTVQASLKDPEHNVLLMGQNERNLVTASAATDTVFMSFISISPIVINELYYCGCNSSAFYFFDQFVELYNSTGDTLYLDGYFMCRSTQVENIIDFDNVDYSLAYYAYAFPGIRGVTHQCPIMPHGYLVLAGDAINHNNYGRLCVDLSHADWEFFNAAANDYDNPAVPNLTPITNQGNDFTFNLAHCALWLATGEDYTFATHCYMSGSSQMCSEYMHVPNRTIVDAVEYSANPASQRYMSIHLDAGLGGNGITRYTGWSIERKVPGLDSNNSAFDFENIYPPTPGFSHSR
jgi:hypothetical protein